MTSKVFFLNTFKEMFIISLNHKANNYKRDITHVYPLPLSALRMLADISVAYLLV